MGVRERGGIMLYPVHSALRERWLGPMRQALGATDVERWWGEGSALSLDGAFSLALAEVAPHLSSFGRSDAVAPLVAGLTSREVEVLRLVAHGHSNKEIARELVLSPRTVERHISNLYGKIDARGKADATAYAIYHGLV